MAASSDPSGPQAHGSAAEADRIASGRVAVPADLA